MTEHDKRQTEAEMVERVARGLCAEDGWDWNTENDPINNSNGGEGGTKYYFEQARAAIAAMREPTEAMIQAGQCAAYKRGRLWADVEPQDCWIDMIDAALAESQQP